MIVAVSCMHYAVPTGSIWKVLLEAISLVIGIGFPDLYMYMTFQSWLIPFGIALYSKTLM